MELKILIVEPNPEIAEIFTKNFAEHFQASVTIFAHAKSAIAHLQNTDIVYSLLISRNVQENEASAIVLLNYIYDNSLQIPFIVLGQFEHAYKTYALILEKTRIENLNRLVLNSLGLRKDYCQKLKLPDYVGYSLKYFYLLDTFPTSIYMKRTRKSGEEFVSKYKTGQPVNVELLEQYAEVGLTEFYVPKDENDVFINAILIQGITAIKQAASLEENMSATEKTFVISSDLIIGLGISDSAILLVDKTLQSMRAQLKKPDQITKLLKKLLDNTMSYSYKRSYLICLLSHMIVPKMDWGGGEQQQVILTKISMISYFHDIFLEEDELLKIMNKEDFESASLSRYQRDLVSNHANRAALLVQSYPRLPQGVDQIIKQHHGVTNGVGFPENLTPALSPMVVFFIVVEDFATQILELKEGDKLSSVIPALKERYRIISFRKIVIELENLLTK
jgi:response regulator RpfG family c-di-GMP phosphodiesterase